MNRLLGRAIGLTSCASFMLGSALAAPCTGSVSEVTAAANHIVLRDSCGTTLVEPWGTDIVRVRHIPAGAPEPMHSLIVNGRRPPSHLDVTESGLEIVAATATLRIVIEKKDGRISFFRSGTKEAMVRENPGRSGLASAAKGLYSARQSFTVPFGAGYHYYGLGQHPAGGLDWQKQLVHLQQANGDTALPLLLTNAGWAVLWDNSSVTDVSVQRPSEGGNIEFSSEAAQDIDYYLIAGPNPDAIIAGYRHLTGAVPMLPRWAFGFWQSYEHYASADEITGVARRYRELGIPIDGIIQDWQYWPDHSWGSHQFDPKRFPDPNKMVADIHALNLHTIVSVWPRFDKGLANTAELDAAGALFTKMFIPNVYPPGQGRWYDPYGKGRDIYWKQIARTLGKNGFDGWWLDASEAELSGDWGEMRDVQTAAGPGSLVYNAYPLFHTTGVYQGHRRDFPDRRPVILTRSAWAGQQRNGAISWSGDIHGDWETFRRQIPAGLNFVSAGLPYWNTDIGGFFAGDPADPAYAELFARWFEWGAFTPMFRVHGTGKSKEMWQFTKEVQPILIRYDRLRYRLMPYIYSLAWNVTSDSGTMMRPLVFDFASDPDALDIPDQFMFGPAIMVAPVTRKGANIRTVYLPAGTDWYDFWTGKRLAAKQTVEAVAPLDTLPLYVRAGAILPMGPVVDYAEAQTNMPLELRVYRGANGHFTLYDDSGNGWGYEKGQRATVEIDWDETAGTLTFSARKGKYPGMKAARAFHIVWVAQNAGIGDAAASNFQTITYKGKTLTIKAP